MRGYGMQVRSGSGGRCEVRWRHLRHLDVEEVRHRVGDLRVGAAQVLEHASDITRALDVSEAELGVVRSRLGW